MTRRRTTTGRSQYEQVYDGKWETLPHDMALACCDCGLVHRVRVRLRKSKLEVRIDRMPHETGGRRAAMRRGKA